MRFDQVGQNFRVVNQVFGSLAPATDLVRSLRGWLSQPLMYRSHQRVEIVQFLRAEDVFNDQIAL